METFKPFMDSNDYWWIAPDTFITPYKLPCFICGEDTDRVDINFEGHFCDSEYCNAIIEDDLSEATRE